ncbi:50S ribosomal protein L25 [Trichlorobacter sp.]|jgi:large subunit ribosomal protein L25|uniref:50S ribosomal protein L25 n=1 Tax=Trichlorobacter sp. TaxID=2911007 RepID=UPI002A35C35B|nr:50S ribosomal protein L25 [Trichlorobacter sp.]MDY0384680.1 50S ribosomal protein L25 [Trichlorobacter sp.]
MQQTQMKIEVRTSTGKGISRKLRAAGRIPGVVYGRGMEPIPVSLEPKALAAAIAGEGGMNNLITLQGGGSLDQTVVIVADLQIDPLKGNAEHVDLHRVNMSEKVRVNVPVLLKGTAAGVKEGGLLDIDNRTLHVECLPGQIPEHIEIDITSIKIGQTIHVQDLALPAGVKCLENPKTPVVGVLGKTKEEEAPAEA